MAANFAFTCCTHIWSVAGRLAADEDLKRAQAWCLAICSTRKGGSDGGVSGRMHLSRCIVVEVAHTPGVGTPGRPYLSTSPPQMSVSPDFLRAELSPMVQMVFAMIKQQ